MRRLMLMALVCLALMAPRMAYAGPSDGVHDFSLDGDPSGGGVKGSIHASFEDGTFGGDFVIPISTLDPAAHVDALSCHHRQSPWNHDVPLDVMFYDEFRMMYSLDADSNIFEWAVTGPPPFSPDSRSLTYSHIHDTAGALGLMGKDLDALESHDHDSYDPIPFPGPPTDWESNPSDAVFFSVENATVFDAGDVYVDIDVHAGLPLLYLDDSAFAPVIGFDPDIEQLDALVVYDMVGSFETFADGGGGLLDSDTIFFSLAPGVFDPVGDNVYWYSASGVGGLYGDPGLAENVDALDVHPIPEPATMGLLAIGGLAALRRKRS